MTVPAFEQKLPDLLADIEVLVRHESPSDDLEALAASADLVAQVGTHRLGVAPERLVVDGVTHLRWTLGDGPRRVLLLGHHDTVWPHGSLETHPFEIVDGVLRGPGSFDMKTGVVMALHAVASLADRDGVTILVTGDEEVGSQTSRQLIEDEARGCRAALVLEAAADGGALKIERKGVSMYEVLVRGRAAHAGLEPDKGVNATIELAHQVLAVAALADAAQGTTVTPTVMSAGSAGNTVPASARLAVDVRATSAAEQLRVDHAIRALEPTLPEAQLEITGGINRPPLESAAATDLFTIAEKVARQLGIPAPTSAKVGGASDGNFTAAIGTPTLDGLGASGGGAHADHEYVLAEELPARTALLAGLVTTLLEEPHADHA